MPTERGHEYRGAVERFGLCVIAVGIVIGTLLAWLMTKAPWSWAHDTDFETAPLLGTSSADMARSLSNSYFVERHIAAEGCLYIGFVVIGIVMTLIGKTFGPSGPRGLCHETLDRHLAARAGGLRWR